MKPKVIELLEAGDASAELLVDAPDGFGRLLVHGLCEFHGLLSASRNAGGRPLVAVYFRKPAAAEEAAEAAEDERLFAVGSGEGAAAAAGAAAGGSARGASPLRQQQDGGAEEGPAAAAAAAAADQFEMITCTDVLLALREAAPLGGFGTEALGRFVRHMHVGSDALSDDYVMVS
jgi:hypothetical protein